MTTYDVSTSPNLIFTGAGFTHNIGAPLAQGMWALIFNHRKIQGTRSVRDLMISSFDYEDIYHRVLNEDTFSDSDRSALNEAISGAFEDLDGIVKSFNTGGRRQAFHLDHFQKLIENMNGGDGLWFTLNHDVFIERWYGGRVILPGVPNCRIAAESDPLQFSMPTPDEVENAKLSMSNEFKYIKLHGSQNWYGPRGYIIGREKRSQIKEEPLLEWYMDIFSAAVKVANAQMLCIGYGFRDEHINEVLVAGINGGMRLHVINPQEPGIFSHNLREQSCEGIFDGLASYHQCTLRDLFPFHTQLTDGSKSQELVRLYRSVLGRDP
jgi:hypothetical protein